ncbi:MAG: endolytic transglycosylase MltG [bacterium]|nr:endolytic transglycosylase MltG [bacterium]
MKIILAILIIITLGAFFLGCWEVYLPKSFDSENPVLFLIKRGEGVREISRNLQSQGIIKSGTFFGLYVFLTDKNLKAGEYELSPAMSAAEVADKISFGQVLKKTITIVEGWTVDDIKEYLRDRGVEGAEGISKEKEGYLFPDTYEVGLKDTAEDIVKMMEDNFLKKITQEIKDEITLQGKTIEEIIKMASLLEKEVVTYRDKQMVAGVLWKRLKIGMPLQVDAARETYKNKGLTEKPICNPGLESIEAAIYPIETDYWFYLSARTGETIFSRNLVEHNMAIEKYLK